MKARSVTCVVVLLGLIMVGTVGVTLAQSITAVELSIDGPSRLVRVEGQAIRLPDVDFTKRLDLHGNPVYGECLDLHGTHISG